MQRFSGSAILAAALLTSQAAQAENPRFSFIDLALRSPADAETILYRFELTTERDDFESATVFFTLANGVRSGCGVFVDAECTLIAAGQTLSIKGVRTGIEGWFAWTADRVVDNHPTELSFGLERPMRVQDYSARLIEPDDVPVAPGVPEPASWAMMIAGFALAGAAARGRRSALA